MNTVKRYNFKAVLGVYILIGLIIAIFIHLLVLSSPRYNWIFPVTGGAGMTTTINPAPGAK